MYQTKLNSEELSLHTAFIDNICNTVEEHNLGIVNDHIEATSMHNNYNLVKAGVLFVRQCLQEFEGHCINADFMTMFISYIQAKAEDFELNHYDPDGVGGGTITDIVNALKSNF